MNETRGGNAQNMMEDYCLDRFFMKEKYEEIERRITKMDTAACC